MRHSPGPPFALASVLAVALAGSAGDWRSDGGQDSRATIQIRLSVMPQFHAEARPPTAQVDDQCNPSRMIFPELTSNARNLRFATVLEAGKPASKRTAAAGTIPPSPTGAPDSQPSARQPSVLLIVPD